MGFDSIPIGWYNSAEGDTNMAVVKVSFSFDAAVAEKLKRRAQEQGKPASRYVAELVEADVRSAQDILAEEGYRLLSADTSTFAETALPVAIETWPAWEEDRAQA
jgi:hypothetical protein